MFRLYKRETREFIKQGNDLAILKKYAREFKDLLYIKSDGINIWDNSDGDNQNITLL